MPISSPNGNGANGQLANAKLLLAVFKWLAIPALGVISVFGTNMLTKGRDAQRLDIVEAQSVEAKKERDGMRQQLSQCVQKDDYNNEVKRNTDQLNRIEDKVDKLIFRK